MPPVNLGPSPSAMVIVDDVSPNLAYEISTDFLTDPKAKSSAKQRRAAMRSRENRYVRIGQGVKACSPGEKYIIKLSTLAFHQLVRRLKQAARLASHFKHEAVKATKNNPSSSAAPKFRALQDNALMCLTHIQTEIEYRTTPAGE